MLKYWYYFKCFLRRLTTVCLTTLLALVLFYFGQNIPFEKQWPLYDALRNTASIVFGVMGAWIALIYPEALSELLGRTLKSETTNKAKEIHKLLLPLIYSTLILIAVLLIGILAPIVQQVSLFIVYSRMIRGISYAFLGMLTVLQLWAVLLTLLPAHVVKQNIDSLQRKQETRQRLLSRTQNHSDE
jgi:Na+/H+-dicarboxylate symporter